MYIKKTTSMKEGKYIVVEKHFSARYGKKCERSKNTGTTTESQKEINKRQADRNRIYKAMCNFEEGDHHIILSYDREKNGVPTEIDAAHDNLVKMLAKLRRKYKDNLVYMGKTEAPPKAKIHHHLLIKDDKLIKDLVEYWKKKHGFVRDVIITSVEDGKLFNYFIKGYSEEDGKIKGGHKVEGCKYTQSRNLKKPEVKTEKIQSGRWVKQPKPKKGYRVEDIYNGFDAAGFEMQRYTMVREIRRC